MILLIDLNIWIGMNKENLIKEVLMAKFKIMYERSLGIFIEEVEAKDQREAVYEFYMNKPYESITSVERIGD
jgi:hypothetical protein